MGRPAARILRPYQAQFTACSGNTPVCLKPVGLTIRVSRSSPSPQWICQRSGRGRRYSQLPPPWWERWYTASARAQRGLWGSLFQTTWGSGRTNRAVPHRSSRLPPVASSNS